MANINKSLLLLLFCPLALTLILPQLDWPSARRVMPRETSTCEGRQSPGPICESCELLSTCVRHSSGWVNIPVEMCDTQNGFYCNSRLGMCSNMTGPCHPFAVDGNFPCTSHGVFPDPYDCQKYHMCYFVGATLVSATVDCGGDKAFNAATGQCSASLQDELCQRKQFECTKAGDAHAWPNSPNIFYICKALLNQDERVLYPTLYRCADGEIFDGYYCRVGVIPTASSVSPSPTPSVGPTDPTATTAITATTPSTATPTQRCTDVGLSPDAQECHMYFYCSAVNGSRRHMQCPSGTYFNPIFSSCTLGDCRNN